MVPDAPPSNLRLKLDGDALAHNWRTLDAMSGQAQTGAAVKADAYGTGVNFAVPVLHGEGCRHFFVAHWGEAAGVMAHVPAEQVYVLHGPTSAAEADYARQAGTMPVINSVPQAKLWAGAGGGPCALMLDSGMNRLGIAAADVSDPVIASLDVRVFMSHLASADENGTQSADQREIYERTLGHFPGAVHSLANSAGIALGPDYNYGLTRPGLSLYGGIARPEHAGKIRQVVHPQAQVLQVRHIAAGERVGYNGEFTASTAMTVATVCIGYADGFLRSWAGAGYLHHAGKRLQLLGKVSMDMVVVDISSAPGITAGDWLDVPYHLPTASRVTGLSQYELLTLLGNRFDRHSA
nr:alanine racemase [Paraurantiacibacter namhicola]